MRMSSLEPSLSGISMEQSYFSHILFLTRREPNIVSCLLETWVSWDMPNRQGLEFLKWIEQEQNMTIGYLFDFRMDRRIDVIATMEAIAEEGHRFSPWTTTMVDFPLSMDVKSRVGALFFSSDTDATLFRLRFKEAHVYV